MKSNILAAADALADQDLLGRLRALAGTEREAAVELVAHLAALELRPSLYLAQGYGSLYAYCTETLRLPEDVACNRIQAIRACRRFPQILDLLASGSLTFSTVRMLGPHLTELNHETVLSRAVNRKRQEIQALVAELAPRPDVPASVRKLPCAQNEMQPGTDALEPASLPLLTELPLPAPPVSMPTAMPTATPIPATAASTRSTSGSAGTADPGLSASAAAAAPAYRSQRPVVQALAPRRYRVQFTIGQEAHDRLRRLQALLRREIPDGDAGMIFERALERLSDEVERAKLGARPATTKAESRAKSLIRPGADRNRPREGRSRHVPNPVKRAVWRRDAGQCAFISPDGDRCTERTFLELHHVRPFALKGPATVENIALRCRRHNQYEAELVFGCAGTHEEWEPDEVR